jgi:cytochrome c biogenesis protein CcdA
MHASLPLIIITGLLDSFNPCAISLMLIYIGLLYSLKKSRATIMLFGAFYIGSIYLTYLLMGLGMLKAFQLFGIPDIVAKLAAILVIIFGILNAKEYFFPNLPLKIRMPLSVRAKAGEWAYKATIPSAIVLGVFIGISQFPCTGAVYLAILGYLQLKVTYVQGIFYLMIYNLMFVAPLIAVFAVASNRVVTEKMINWQEKNGRKMHLLLAVLMITLGLLIWFLL